MKKLRLDILLLITGARDLEEVKRSVEVGIGRPSLPAARWAIDNAELLKDAEPDIPDVITNSRMRDNWRVLLAVADAVGGNWAQRARKTAIVATGRATGADSITEMLLSEMRALFHALFHEYGERVQSAKAVEHLTGIEERPWGEWRQGQSITSKRILESSSQ